MQPLERDAANDTFDPDVYLFAMGALADGLKHAAESKQPVDPALLADALRSAEHLVRYARAWLSGEVRGWSNANRREASEYNHG